MNQNTAHRPMQFTIRTALLAMLAVALAFGWYKTVVHEQLRNEELSRLLRLAQSEIRNARTRAKFDERPKGEISATSDLSEVRFDGASLRGISISGGGFQGSSFKNCDLRDATLIGGGCSFQASWFDGANLTNATLTGAGSSFQLASFAGADLSGAVLTGNLQGASFEGAKLIGARIVTTGVGFQGANIDAAQFQGADLSLLDAHSLEGCYFNTPPLYDEKTLFPSGFAPAAQGWTRVE